MNHKGWLRALLVLFTGVLLLMGVFGRHPPSWGGEAWYQNHLRWQAALDQLGAEKATIPLEELTPFPWDTLHLFNAKYAYLGDMQALTVEPFPYFEQHSFFRDIHHGAHFLFIKDGRVVSYGFDPQMVYYWPYNFPLPLAIYRENKPFLEAETQQTTWNGSVYYRRWLTFFIGDAEPPPPAWIFESPSQQSP